MSHTHHYRNPSLESFTSHSDEYESTSPISHEHLPQNTTSPTVELWTHCWNGDVSSLQELVEESRKQNEADPVDVNTVDAGESAGEGEGGFTALHYAAGWGQQSLVEALLILGADADAQDLMGRTPLHWAVRSGAVPSIACLADLGIGYPQDRGSRNNLPIIQMLIAHGVKSGMPDNEGNTPLHFAASEGRADVVRVLLKAKADPTHLNALGQSPLELAEKLKLPSRREAVEGALAPAERNAMRRKVAEAKEETERLCREVERLRGEIEIVRADAAGQVSRSRMFTKSVIVIGVIGGAVCAGLLLKPRLAAFGLDFDFDFDLSSLSWSVESARGWIGSLFAGAGAGAGGGGEAQ